MMTQDVFSVDEAAALIRCHPQTLRRAIKHGVLRAARIGRSYTISRSDLAAFYSAKGGGQLFADDAPDVPEA